MVNKRLRWTARKKKREHARCSFGLLKQSSEKRRSEGARSEVVTGVDAGGDHDGAPLFTSHEAANPWHGQR
jgi:hypothetical protein